MANNYQQWSQTIALKNKKERVWWERVLKRTDEDDEARLRSLGIADEFPSAAPDDWESWPLFEWEVLDGGKALWVYSSESGDLEVLAFLVQQFFRQFRKNGVFRLTWANTCDKMRVGEFGGGALHVDAKKILWHTPGHFFDQIDNGIIT